MSTMQNAVSLAFQFARSSCTTHLLRPVLDMVCDLRVTSTVGAAALNTGAAGGCEVGSASPSEIPMAPASSNELNIVRGGASAELREG